MAAGDAFTVAPDVVITLEPVYNNVLTPTESMKKERFNISATPVERYQLEFKVNTDTERDAILTHFKDQSGDYFPFSWQSVPSYIGGGSNITGNWVGGSLQMTQNSNRWKITVNFEKAN